MGVAVLKTLLVRLIGWAFGRWLNKKRSFDHKREVVGKNMQYALDRYFKADAVEEVAEEYGIPAGDSKSKTIQRLMKSNKLKMTVEFKFEANKDHKCECPHEDARENN